MQNTTDDLFAVIAENKSAHVETLIKARELDNQRLSWLKKCIQCSSIQRILPGDYFSVGTKTWQVLSRDFDEYGDSFTKPVVPEEMTELIERILFDDDSATLDMDNDPPTHFMYFLEQELGEDHLDVVELQKYNFLRGFKIAFRHEIGLNRDELFRLKMSIQFYGGVISNEMDDDTTHVIVFDPKFPIKKQNPMAMSVRQQWLEDCLSQTKNLDEYVYLTA